MLSTARYRRHHDELLALFHDVVDIAAADVEKEAAHISKTLTRMYGLLVVHLALEDRSLYPRMRSCNNPALQRLAARYETEMGNLKQRFEAFYQEWSSTQLIRSQAREFKRHSDAVIRDLIRRIERENVEFYPRIDADEARAPAYAVHKRDTSAAVG